MRASSPPGARAPRLGALDGLRFLAALGVVAFHFTGINPAWDGRAPSPVDPVGRWAAYGAMGVPLFFVISGFVVLMTAWGRDVPHFVASRVGRLFPAYWAAVVLGMAFAFVIWPTGSVSDGHAPTKVEALVNLTMMQGAVHVPDLSGAFWTLWTEARFYALLAAFILIGITRRRVLAFATLWPIAGVVAERMDLHLLSTVLIFDYAPYFAGGMLLYLLYREGHDAGTWVLVGLQALFAMVFAVDLYPKVLTRATGWPVSGKLVALISLACFGLVAVVVLTRLNTYTARWITVLGALTYPLYLVHEKVGFFVIRVLRDTFSPWLALGAGLVAAVVAALLLHHTVERPWGNRLRAATLRGLRRDTARPAPPTGEPQRDIVPPPRAPALPVLPVLAARGD